MTELARPQRGVRLFDAFDMMAAAERRASAVHNLGRYWKVPVNRLADRPPETIVRVIASAANGDALLVRVVAQRAGNRLLTKVYATSTTPGSPNGTDVKPDDVDAWFRDHSGRKS